MLRIKYKYYDKNTYQIRYINAEQDDFVLNLKSDL